MYTNITSYDFVREMGERFPNYMPRGAYFELYQNLMDLEEELGGRTEFDPVAIHSEWNYFDDIEEFFNEYDYKYGHDFLEVVENLRIDGIDVILTHSGTFIARAF